MKMKLRQHYHLFTYLIFLEALQISFDFFKKDFFFHQFKLLIQKVICRISRFGRNSVLAGILFAQCKRH